VLVYRSTDEYDEDFHDDCTCTVNARHFPTKGDRDIVRNILSYPSQIR
jgi:hypothetical protein